MVDADGVAAMVQRLRGELAYLSARASDDRAAVRADEERMSGLKYSFVTALETVVNVAQHLCASEEWGPPSSNAASLTLLGEQEVLSRELAQRLCRQSASATSWSISTRRSTMTRSSRILMKSKIFGAS